MLLPNTAPAPLAVNVLDATSLLSSSGALGIAAVVLVPLAPLALEVLRARRSGEGL